MSELDRPELDERPPVLGSWNALYAVVLGNLALMVAVFSAITWWYAP
jgi:hypothetical protein